MFQWKNEYSVNVEEINNQHKRLFEIGNEIAGKVKNYDSTEDNYDEIKKLLKELEDYTRYHFDYEEKLMAKYNYEGLKKQKEQHKHFVDKISNLIGDDIYINQKQSLMKMLTFVLDWISTHILKCDMDYKDCLNSQGQY